MRCSTPIILVSLIGKAITWFNSFNLKKGNQYIKYPSKKIRTVLLAIFNSTSDCVFCFHFSATKLKALPTAKRKEGNTRSVGVKPFHLACNKGENVTPPLPG